MSYWGVSRSFSSIPTGKWTEWWWITGLRLIGWNCVTFPSHSTGTLWGIIKDCKSCPPLNRFSISCMQYAGPFYGPNIASKCLSLSYINPFWTSVWHTVLKWPQKMLLIISFCKLRLPFYFDKNVRKLKLFLSSTQCCSSIFLGPYQNSKLTDCTFAG